MRGEVDPDGVELREVLAAGLVAVLVDELALEDVRGRPLFHRDWCALLFPNRITRGDS